MFLDEYPFFYSVKNTILKDFNFEEVHRAMVKLDWQWARADGLRVPTISELKTEADRLLTDVIESSKNYDGTIFHATGGFKAVINKEEETLELLFVLEEKSNHE